MKLRFTAFAVPVAILFAPGLVQSCGPFIESALFTTYEVAYPGAFASGELGVLRPAYTHSNLLMVYRTLSGIPLDTNESPAPAWSNIPPDSAKPWLDARNQLPGVTPIPKIETDNKVPADEFESYANCLPPSFANAVDTLNKRVASWGASSPQLTEWLRGQDAVFENCSGGSVIPGRIPQAEALLAADREYQIAAAEFYSGQFEKAEADFDRIAADTASPWHDISAYVAARVCIREGTLGKNSAKLLEADKRLRAIANDPARGNLHTSAQDLLNFVRARTQRAANGVDYLCSETLAWAKVHPDDTRVPQALYLAVEATHYSAWQNSGNEWSKQAFTLLHSRYPASPWTAKTKYWY